MKKKMNVLGIIGDESGEEAGKLYVYKNVHGNDGDMDISSKPMPWADCVGVILIKYTSFVIPGMTIEELHAQERKEAFDILEKQGRVTKNDCGTRFWKE